MSLNLGCDFRPHIRWMASTASWKISTENGADPVEWQHTIFDLAGIQTGWGMFSEGATPAKIGKGNTNIPKLRIVRWANRPAELPASKAKRTDCQASPATENADGKLNDDLNIIL